MTVALRKPKRSRLKDVKSNQGDSSSGEGVRVQTRKKEHPKREFSQIYGQNESGEDYAYVIEDVESGEWDTDESTVEDEVVIVVGNKDIDCAKDTFLNKGRESDNDLKSIYEPENGKKEEKNKVHFQERKRDSMKIEKIKNDSSEIKVVRKSVSCWV